VEWILGSNRSAAEQRARLEDGRSGEIAAFRRWYTATYTPAGAVQGVLMQGLLHVQSPFDDNPETTVAADAARYTKLSALNAAIEKMA